MNSIDKNYIEENLKGYPYIIDVRETVTSTNSIMKNDAGKGKDEFSVLIASSQTEGRGRMGRSFFSPDGTGLYMSVLYRIVKGENPLLITTNAAVATAKALEKISGKTAGIKWVNDIYLDGRKVCGILAESSVGENGFVVLGIGVNAVTPNGGFPEDIKMRAGSVSEKNEEHLREKIAVEILKNLHSRFLDEETLEEYRRRSVVTGKEIDIIKNGTTERAVALAINDDYSLKVKKADGSIEDIFSGEVSITAYM